MKQNVIVRNETKEDYRAVEELTRNAFWNCYMPGCDEHYLVHIMRQHVDFIPELDLVIELDQQVIGNIMYTKSWLIDEEGREKEILTFGPVSIHPQFQRKGYGKKLLEESFQRAKQLGYDAIVIMGSPSNYVGSGFQSCKKYNISLENQVFPTAMLVKELKPGVLGGKKWNYLESELYQVDSEKAQEFDLQFEKREKGYQPSQEEFYIYSHSTIS